VSHPVIRLASETSAAAAGGAAAPAQHHLGPATVLPIVPGVDPRREVDVRLGDGRAVRARMAMPLPYEPCGEDVVLVIGDEGGHYVIGVLDGRGRTIVEMHGDVDLRALGGTLSLQSDRAVRIDAPEVEVVARRLRTVADAVVQTATTLRQRIAELYSTHAGQVHTVADGSVVSQAKSTTLLSEEKVTINGKAVHLG
jgi:Protein of unknown function (DUF3540)